MRSLVALISPAWTVTNDLFISALIHKAFVQVHEGKPAQFAEATAV